MNKSIAIIGAGGQGKVVGEIAYLNKYKKIHFFDDNHLNIKNYPFDILGDIDFFEKKINNYEHWFVALGNNAIRKKIIKRFIDYNEKLTNLIHPKCFVSQFSTLNNGICVMANATVNPGTKINQGSIINTSSSIDHDCDLGCFVHIAPNSTLSGNVKIGELTLVGSGSSIHQGIKLGNNVKTGVGSKIYKDISDNIVFKN
tara:strand:+ start:333 stop:932 length:600 start_codon:yes stop_codon:yes gene_type:complete